VYDDRVEWHKGHNDTQHHRVFFPDDLPENTPGVALQGKLDQIATYGKEYAETKRGRQQTRIAAPLTPKHAQAWRNAHMCACGSIKALNGTCMLECGN
jgi:hypothetical protein